MEYLLGLIGVLIGGIFYYKTKAQTAGSLLENTETKKKINESDREIAANAGRIDAEQERIKALQDSTGVDKKKEMTNEEIAEFLNKYRKP